MHVLKFNLLRKVYTNYFDFINLNITLMHDDLFGFTLNVINKAISSNNQLF